MTTMRRKPGRRPTSGLGSLLRRLGGRGDRGADHELDDELQFHIEMEAKTYVAQGMDESEALRQARIKFGAIERAKEECRDERRGSHAEMLIQDVRFALRTLSKNVGFSAAAVLTLALGIGANTAIFSVINGVLLRPLPYRDGNQLVLLNQDTTTTAAANTQFSIKEVLDYREQTRSFEGIVEYHTMSFVLLGRGEPERVQTGVVSDNFFDVLGVTPYMGRTFVDGDDDLDAEAVLVLNYGYWERAFGADPDIVGKVFEMNDRPHTVVGVLPPIPQFPNEVDVYMSTSACPFRAAGEQRMEQNRRAFSNLVVFGRLKGDVSVASASAEVAGVAGRFRRDFPETYPEEIGFVANAVDLKEELVRNARPTMLMLIAAAGLVLLIACANVANLTLARVIRRERELAVRAALGAGRGRLLRQMVTESTVLSLIGGAFGLVLAYVGLDLLVGFAARFTPRAVTVDIDGWVLGFTLLVSLATGVIFGSAPALPGADNVAVTIKEGGRGSAGGKHNLRRTLIVAQVALSFVLLIGAGLMLRSLMRLQSVEPGFTTENVLTARVTMNWSSFATMQEGNQYLDALAAQLETSPFARAAALTAKPPYRSQNPRNQPFQIDGVPLEEGQVAPEFDSNSVTPGYFDVLDIPLLAGRTFDQRDEADSAPVAVINQSMASRHWADANPIGARVSTDGGESWINVIGVVGDTRLYGPEKPVTDELYRPTTQQGMATWVLVRTVGDPLSAAGQLKEIAYSIGSVNPISDLSTLATWRQDALASPRLTAMLLGLFALLALVVTVTGIAGVMAFSVSQRTREMGIRMALGARKSGVLAMVVRQGMGLVGVGLIFGIVGALAFGRVLSGLLFDTPATDPATFVVVSASLLVASLVACLVPARRATSVDPVEALRTD